MQEAHFLSWAPAAPEWSGVILDGAFKKMKEMYKIKLELPDAFTPPPPPSSQTMEWQRGRETIWLLLFFPSELLL